MGQKVNPKSFRLKVVNDFENNWFSINNYAVFLMEDQNIRKEIKKRLKNSSISKMQIKRKGSDRVLVDIHSAKPGMILGKGGESIMALRQELTKIFSREFHLNVIEEKKPELSAKLLSEIVAAQLEKRVPFRRAMKMIVQSAMKAGAEGIQVKCAGRLGGVEIARNEWYQNGRMPLHTLRAKVDYHFTEADTIYGKIGIKVWVNLGEKLVVENVNQEDRQPEQQAEEG